MLKNKMINMVVVRIVQRLLPIIFLLYGLNKVVAQSVGNNRLYELYDEGKYREAADAFALVDSLDKLDFEEHDARQGYGKHWQENHYDKRCSVFINTNPI